MKYENLPCAACGEIFGNPPTGGMGNATISMSQGFTCADSALKYIGKN